MKVGEKVRIQCTNEELKLLGVDPRVIPFKEYIITYIDNRGKFIQIENLDFGYLPFRCVVPVRRNLFNV